MVVFDHAWVISNLVGYRELAGIFDDLLADNGRRDVGQGGVLDLDRRGSAFGDDAALSTLVTMPDTVAPSVAVGVSGALASRKSKNTAAGR